MTDIAAIAPSSPVNDLRLSITNSIIEGEFTDEDRRQNQFITGVGVTPETETTTHWDQQQRFN
jgi:hypothetical protein